LPGVQGMENAVHYKINKIFQRLNIEDIEEEEVDIKFRYILLPS
jgi:hypothetical protein